MNLLSDLFERIKFWKNSDRIGPDIPYTHWMLHFNKRMRSLCKKKFKHFGDEAEFRPGAYAICCSCISIGNRVVVRPGTMLHGDPDATEAGIIIEDDVLIGSDVHIYVNNHIFSAPDIPIIEQGCVPSRKVVLKKGCWVGAHVIVLPGVTIGQNAVIGAGSVVTKSIPDRVVAAGNPAVVIREL